MSALAISWDFEEHWSGEIARLEEGRISALVRDRDGDSAYWWVKIDGREFCEGECWDFQSFATAKAFAEIAIEAARRDSPHWTVRQ